MQQKNKPIKINLSFPNTHHLSSRSVSMRDIVVGVTSAPLYPAYRHCGVTNGARGFTLIELLVVVLIIGILAAVALPQYHLAVKKARATEAITALESIKQAQERYYLANGSYTDKFDELDLSLPGTVSDSGLSITLTSGITLTIGTKLYAYAVNKTNTNTFMFVYSHINDADAGKRICHAKKNNLKANQLCKSLGGKNPKESSSCVIGSCTVYEL